MSCFWRDLYIIIYIKISTSIQGPILIFNSAPHRLGISHLGPRMRIRHTYHLYVNIFKKSNFFEDPHYIASGGSYSFCAGTAGRKNTFRDDIFMKNNFGMKSSCFCLFFGTSEKWYGTMEFVGNQWISLKMKHFDRFFRFHEIHEIS